MSTAAARDSIKRCAQPLSTYELAFRWAMNLFSISTKFSCGVSDASPALFGGLVGTVIPAVNDDQLEFVVCNEPYKNDDGSIIEYGTDCVHVKRKVIRCIELH